MLNRSSHEHVLDSAVAECDNTIAKEVAVAHLSQEEEKISTGKSEQNLLSGTSTLARGTAASHPSLVAQRTWRYRTVGIRSRRVSNVALLGLGDHRPDDTAAGVGTTELPLV